MGRTYNTLRDSKCHFRDPQRDIASRLLYTVELMSTSPCQPRSLSGAPALLAVLAILVAAPVLSGGAGTTGPIGRSLARMVSAPVATHVFVKVGSSDAPLDADRFQGRSGVRSVEGDDVLDVLGRLGPLRLVLPPPSAC